MTNKAWQLAAVSLYHEMHWQEMCRIMFSWNCICLWYLRCTMQKFSVLVCKHNIQTWPLFMVGTPPISHSLSPDILSVAHSAQLTQETTWKMSDELFWFFFFLNISCINIYIFCVYEWTVRWLGIIWERFSHLQSNTLIKNNYVIIIT